MPRLLIYPAIEAERLARLQQAVTGWDWISATTDEEALEAIPSVDALLGKPTPRLLAAAPQLAWVQAPTASLEHYLFPELVAHPCRLTNMRGLFSDVIADQVLGYLLCFTRQLHVYIRQQTQGVWEPVGGEAARSDFRFGPSRVTAIDWQHGQLAGATLGIVGLGGIGRETARRARAFGMHIVAIDPRPEAWIDAVDELRGPDDLEWLLKQSDYVVLAAPQTPATEHLMTATQFRLMKPSAILVNIARGALVDLHDLTAALQSGTLAGAALDVYETEPLPAEHPLWRLPNVILTPHIAGYAPCVAQRHFEVLVDNLNRFAAGEPLRNLVDKTLGYEPCSQPE